MSGCVRVEVPHPRRDARIRRRRGRDCPTRRAASPRSRRRPCRETRRADWRGRCDAPAATARPCARSRRTDRTARSGSVRRSSGQQPLDDAARGCASPYSDSCAPHSEFDEQLAEHVAASPAGPGRRGSRSSGYTVSITGRTPPAMRSSARASADSGAPNEPMMRYCCWNNCIRLMLPAGPEVAPQVTSRPPRFSDSSEPSQVSAPVCSNTTSTPLLARSACGPRPRTGPRGS